MIPLFGREVPGPSLHGCWFFALGVLCSLLPLVAAVGLQGSFSYLKASMSRSTFCASPCTRMWAWNFRRASSSSMPEKSISSTTQL